MPSTLRYQATVLPGHRLEITAPELPEGEAVEVLVMLPFAADQPRRSALDIIASLHGHRLFKTADEVDEYLEAERAAWQR